MILGYNYKDTPSIIDSKYTNLSSREKRDYLFDQGIRPTAYENYKNEERPSVIIGLVQFGKAALKSILNERLSETLTRSSEELEEPKPKHHD